MKEKCVCITIKKQRRRTYLFHADINEQGENRYRRIKYGYAKIMSSI